jgi:hypothetical protein
MDQNQGSIPSKYKNEKRDGKRIVRHTRSNLLSSKLKGMSAEHETLNKPH